VAGKTYEMRLGIIREFDLNAKVGRIKARIPRIGRIDARGVRTGRTSETKGKKRKPG